MASLFINEDEDDEDGGLTLQDPLTDEENETLQVSSMQLSSRGLGQGG